jgi:hypothetical protein
VHFTEALSADHMVSRLRLFALVIMDCRPGGAPSRRTRRHLADAKPGTVHDVAGEEQEEDRES